MFFDITKRRETTNHEDPRRGDLLIFSCAQWWQKRWWAHNHFLTIWRQQTTTTLYFSFTYIYFDRPSEFWAARPTLVSYIYFRVLYWFPCLIFFRHLYFSVTCFRERPVIKSEINRNPFYPGKSKWCNLKKRTFEEKDNFWRLEIAERFFSGRDFRFFL